MKYIQATKLQRFLVYLIDIAIINLLVTLCAQGFSKLIHFDVSVGDAFLEAFLKALEGTEPSIRWDYLWEYLKYVLIENGIQLMFTLIFILIYLVILPMVWSSQTLGRVIMKTRVVNKDGTKVTKGKIVLREVVGTFLLYMLVGSPALLASLILILTGGRSLVDYVGKTSLVSLIDNGNEPVEAKEENEYVDAKFKEVKEDEKSNSSNDEYTIL